MSDVLSKASVLVTQGGADTTAYVQFSLPDLDGKSGYEIVGMRAFWSGAQAAAAADHVLNVVIQTSGTAVKVPTDAEYIDAVSWGQMNTAGVAVTLNYEPYKEHVLLAERVTVQDVYAAVASTTTGLTNTVYVSLYYRVVKLSELEYLRLLAGGA